MWMWPLAYGGPSCRMNGSAPSALLQRLAVDVDLVPEREPLGLACSEVRPHRELGLRQVHRLLVVVAPRRSIPLRPVCCGHTKRRTRPTFCRDEARLESRSAVPPSLRRDPLRGPCAPLGRPVTGASVEAYCDRRDFGGVRSEADGVIFGVSRHRGLALSPLAAGGLGGAYSSPSSPLSFLRAHARWLDYAAAPSGGSNPPLDPRGARPAPAGIKCLVDRVPVRRLPQSTRSPNSLESPVRHVVSVVDDHQSGYGNLQATSAARHIRHGSSFGSYRE